MSFSSEVKEELSHVDGHENHCMIAELAAIIGLCGKIKCEDGRYSLILHTENVSVARRFYSLIKDVFHFQPQVSTTQHEFLKKNRFYMISIEESGQTLKILKTAQLINNLGQMDEEFSVKDNPVLQRTCCRRAFLRGAFLSAGSITDPEKNYHFEVVSTNVQTAELARTGKLRTKRMIARCYDIHRNQPQITRSSQIIRQRFYLLENRCE